MAWAGGATQQSERFHRRYGAVLGRGLSGPRRAQRAVHHDGSNLVFFFSPFPCPSPPLPPTLTLASTAMLPLLLL